MAIEVSCNGNGFQVKQANICIQRYLPVNREVQIGEEQMVSEGRFVSFEVPRSKPQKTLLCWQRGRQTCSTASILHAECWPAANSHTEPERPQCSFFQIRVTESLEKN